MLGSILVVAAFAACGGSVVSYALHLRKEGPAAASTARYLYLLSGVLVLAISAHLLTLIINHQFQYTYVWSYSSRDLPLPLLISTFYAGQEGSFMLWTLFTAIIGIFLLRSTARSGYETEVMAVYGLIQTTLLLMLVVKSPFKYVWETWPGDVQPGFTPADGRGLNPLLQNYWMVIHPQVLFSGFASMAVPYAFSVAALLKRDYNNWIRPATPWLAFGALALGAGIMLGGFWAYETLGWGGYWGWDPVENSSLVPWLVAIATIHTILSQRRSGAFVKTNLVLGMLCFVFVLYSTFLTRSGVLGDTSVHSFVDPGMLVYWLLIGMIVLFVGLGAGMFFVRRRELPKPLIKHNYVSREFALFLGASALMISAILIIVGTSSPVITDILQGKKSAVDISYYSRTNTPLGITIALLTGVAQLLWWTRSEKGEFLRGLRFPAAAGLVGTIAVFAVAGVREVSVVPLVFTALFALLVNLQVGWRIVKGNPKYAGGAVAHIGLALMLIGFVGSSVYDSKETVSLTQGRSVQALGYTMTYRGYRLLERERYTFDVHVEHEGRSFVVSPVMFTSSYSEGIIKNPDRANLLIKDFYVAPLALEQKSAGELGSVTLSKGVTKELDSLSITLEGFDIAADQRTAMAEGKDARIGVRLKVLRPRLGVAEVVPATIVGKGSRKDAPARLGERYEFAVGEMRPTGTNGEFEVDIAVKDLKNTGAAEPDVLIVEASVKPLINLVWAGVIILLVGFLITIIRRSQEARANVQTPQEVRHREMEVVEKL